MSDNTHDIKLSDAERSLWDDASFADRQEKLNTLSATLDVASDPLQAATCKLEIAGLQLDLDNKPAATEYLQGLIDVFIEHSDFERAAITCQYVYLCDNDNAVSAIGQAAWLAITYPVDPDLTISILDHIVDETPDESDGGAVAAATAHYVADLRAPEHQKAHLQHITGSMLARVAKRHSKITDQQQFDLWARTLELDEPEKFLVRMRNVIDVMVQQDWWFDRENLQSALPEEDE